MLCEVKTINSAGRGVSTRNPNLRDFEISADRIAKKIDDHIENAAHQRAELIKEHLDYARLPFLVALVLDFLVDLHVYPRTFNKDVSGILRIEPDLALGKAFGELSDAEKDRRLRNDDATGLPPNSKDFFSAKQSSPPKSPKGFSRPVHHRRLWQVPLRNPCPLFFTPYPGRIAKADADMGFYQRHS